MAVSVLKVTQIGNPVGVIFLKETLVRLKLVKGGTVFTTKTTNGIQLTF